MALTAEEIACCECLDRKVLYTQPAWELCQGKGACGDDVPECSQYAPE